MREAAEGLAARGWEVDVLTTCDERGGAGHRAARNGRFKQIL